MQDPRPPTDDGVRLTSMMILPALSPSMVMSKKTRGFPMIGGPRGAEHCGRRDGVAAAPLQSRSESLRSIWVPVYMSRPCGDVTACREPIASGGPRLACR